MSVVGRNKARGRVASVGFLLVKEETVATFKSLPGRFLPVIGYKKTTPKTSIAPVAASESKSIIPPVAAPSSTSIAPVAQNSTSIAPVAESSTKIAGKRGKGKGKWRRKGKTKRKKRRKGVSLAAARKELQASTIVPAVQSPNEYPAIGAPVTEQKKDWHFSRKSVTETSKLAGMTNTYSIVRGIPDKVKLLQAEEATGQKKGAKLPIRTLQWFVRALAYTLQAPAECHLVYRLRGLPPL